MNTQHQTPTAQPRHNTPTDLRLVTAQTTPAVAQPLFSRRALRRLVAEMID